MLRDIAERLQPGYSPGMDAIAEKLDIKLGKWKREISEEVWALVSEVIDATSGRFERLVRCYVIAD